MAEYNIWRSPYSKVQLASAVGKNPIIQNEYWMVWDIDTMQYVNTGVKARGEKGEDGLSEQDPTGTGSLSLNRLEGSNIGTKSVALGNDCVASGNNSIASGYKCEAEGQNSVAFGSTAKAQGSTTGTSVAIGFSVISKAHQFVCGMYNKEVVNTIMRFIVGIGSSTSDRRNGFAIGTDGKGYFANDVYVNSDCATSNSGNKLLTTEDAKSIIEENYVPEYAGVPDGAVLKIVDGKPQWV